MTSHNGRIATVLILKPLTWAIALLWLAAHSAARGTGRLLGAYESATSAAGQAALRAARTAARALGPVGRRIRRLLTPIGRVLRRAWDWLGLRIVLFLFRPLGRAGRWLVTRTRPAVDRARSGALAVVRRADPAMRALADATQAIERTAQRLHALLRRACAPAVRAVTAAVATLRR